MKFESKEIFTLAGAAISYILFVVLVSVSNLSVNSLVNLQNYLLKSAILRTEGSGTINAISIILQPFFSILLAIILLVLFFSFLSSYGYFDINKKLGLAAGLITAVITLIVFPTITGAFLAISLIVACFYITPLANTYGKEFRKWVKFRVGSNAVGKALLIFNVLLALGIFFSVLSSSQFYQSSFKNELKSTLTEIALAALPAAGVPNDVKTEVESRVANSVENSPLINAYLRWLPVLSALGVWVILEFLRNIIFSNIGGLFNYVLSTFHEKRK